MHGYENCSVWTYKLGHRSNTFSKSLTHWGWDKMATILQMIFLHENVWIFIKISLKFVPVDNIPALVPIMAWCRVGNKQLSKQMLVSMVSLLMHFVSLGLNELTLITNKKSLIYLTATYHNKLQSIKEKLLVILWEISQSFVDGIINLPFSSYIELVFCHSSSLMSSLNNLHYWCVLNYSDLEKKIWSVG